MLYLCGLDLDAQERLADWLQRSGLRRPSAKAGEKLRGLQERLRESRDLSGTAHAHSKILGTQAQALFRQHRNLEQVLWCVHDPIHELDFWWQQDPAPRCLLHFDRPEATLARQLQRDQRNAYRAETLQEVWQQQAMAFLQHQQTAPDRCLLVHSELALREPARLTTALQERWQWTLSPTEAVPEEPEISPVDALLAGALLLDHLDLQELYAELLHRSPCAPEHQYHASRFVEELRLRWDEYQHLETHSRHEAEKARLQAAVTSAQQALTDAQQEYAETLEALHSEWEQTHVLQLQELTAQLREETAAWRERETCQLEIAYEARLQEKLSQARHQWLAEQEWRFTEQFEAVEQRFEETHRSNLKLLYAQQRRERERFEQETIEAYEEKLEQARATQRGIADQRNQAQKELEQAKQLRKDGEEENELLLLQLHQVQEELEHYFQKNQQLEEQAQAYEEKLEQARATQRGIADQRNQAQKELEQAKQQIAQLQEDWKKRAQEEGSSEKLKEAEEENELLLLQLHQVQEELEHYFLEYKRLQEESAPAKAPPQSSNPRWANGPDPWSSKKPSFRQRLRRKLRTLRDVRYLKKHKAVDARYYLDRNYDVAAARMDPTEHYVRFGWQEGRQPHPNFDGERYLQLNPDVRAAGLNPLLHWLRHGQKEGRSGGMS